MKRALLIIITLGLAVMSIMGCMSEDARMQKFITDSADIINKDCPKLINSGTRLDNVTGLPNKTIQFSSTLMNYSKSQLTDSQLETSKTNAIPIMINNIKSNSSLKRFREYGATFKCIYKSNDGFELFIIKITPADYQ